MNLNCAINMAVSMQISLRALHLHAHAQASHAPGPHSIGLGQDFCVCRAGVTLCLADRRVHKGSDHAMGEFIPAQFPLLTARPLSRRCLRRCGVAAWGRARWVPSLVLHNACRELTVAASRAACPDVTLNTAKVHTADEAGVALVRPFWTPGILERPIGHPRQPVHAPTYELNAMSSGVGRAICAIVNSGSMVVEERSKIGIVIDAHMQRPIGKHLYLHLPDLALHSRPLIGGPPLTGLVAAQAEKVSAAVWKILLHDPTKTVDPRARGRQAVVHTPVKAGARAASIVPWVSKRALIRMVWCAAGVLVTVH